MRLPHYPMMLLGLALLGPVLAPQAANAQAYNITTFDYPNAANTFAHGLNNSGLIVGRYDSSGGAVTSGFSVNVGSLTAAGFTSYTTGDAFSELDAVNNFNGGQVVGDYTRSDNTNPGFLVNGAGHTDFNPGGSFTIPGGINLSGAVSGTTFDTNNLAQGFVRSSGGTVTFFNDPKADAQGTFGTGINDAGTTIGYYFNSGGYNTAFMDKNGVFTDLSLPSANSSIAYGINKVGDIVGFYQLPGTTAFGPRQGFLLTAGGTLMTVNVPGAVSTEIFGINDSRQLVGDYQDAAGNFHGFFAAPTPEPSGWLVLDLGVLGLSAQIVRAARRRA